MKKLIISMLMMLTGAIWSNAQKNTELQKTLQENPLVALETAHKTKYNFIKDVFFTATARKETVNLPSMLEKITQFEQECPYFLLDECSETTYCFLSRGFESSFRNSFEETVSDALYEKIKENNTRPVTYLSFASGYLFMDLIILTKTLTRAPNAAVNIHLIDTEYFPYTTELSQCTTTLLDPAITTYYVPILKALFRQFISVLTSMFPYATITVTVYDDEQGYTSALLISNTTPYPDVVIAADLPSSFHVATDYRKLLTVLLKERPTLKNFHLNAYNCLPFNNNLENKEIGAYAGIESFTLNPKPPFDLSKHTTFISTEISKHTIEMSKKNEEALDQLLRTCSCKHHTHS